MLLLLAVPAWAAEPASPDFFETRIRPVLAKHCFECHAEELSESGLRVDSLAALLSGGERGPAIVPGDAKRSLLVLAIQHADQVHMPPDGKIPQRQIDDVAAWIAAGAHWPGEQAPIAAVATSGDSRPITDEERAFWAFQPIVRRDPPQVRDVSWSRSPIDRFILARLEEAAVPPATAADARTWLRRVAFDLVGLPPTPEEIEEFLADNSVTARERVVDRLLGSPRYGERWGRHWLDVARYADSNGLDENLALASAWRYRDYVVRAMNADKPFDSFVQEQIAGDLLPCTGDAAADSDALTATGYLSIGAKMLAEDDPLKMQMDIIDEQLDTLGQSLLGLTLGCARCHDHKFDPLRMDDYYGLAGIFKSTKTMENFSVVARWQERPLGTPEELREHASLKEIVDARQAEIDRFQTRLKEELPKQARSLAGWLLLAAHRQSQLDEIVKTAPAGESAPGAMLIEAESYMRGNVEKATSGYGEGIGVLVNRGETPNFVEYDIAIAEAGFYKLDVRYAAASPRPCVLSVNRQTIDDSIADEATGGWNPDSQVWRTAAFFELPAGANVLRVENAQAFPHIDKFLLSPALDAHGSPLVPPLAEAPDGRDLPRPMAARWAEYLKAPPAAAEATLAAWRAMAAGDAAKLESLAGERLSAPLLAEPRPRSLEELAARYQERFQAAELAPASASSDELLTPFRQILFDPAGPCSLPEKPETWYGAADQATLAKLQSEKQAAVDAVPKLPEAMAVSEGSPEDLRIHLRGSHVTLGKQVARRFPTVLAGAESASLPSDGSGRLQLAQWLTRPDHPLTSRVIANRVWLWHFGDGLVRSPDNFGALGERPTHPELLDWLASDLVRSGWSLKTLHRQIVLSATYAQGSLGRAADEEVDPDNRLFRRANRRRLDAEAIRDSLLAVGDSLDLKMGGSLLPTPNRQYVTSTASVDPVVYDTRRRSLYVPVVRSALYEFFQAFDFGDPTVLQGSRQSTVVAPQSLFLMNGKVAREQAASLADRLLVVPGASQRIEHAYAIAFGRSATSDEKADASEFLSQFTDEREAWRSYCRALIAASEFIYID